MIKLLSASFKFRVGSDYYDIVFCDFVGYGKKQMKNVRIIGQDGKVATTTATRLIVNKTTARYVLETYLSESNQTPKKYQRYE